MTRAQLDQDRADFQKLYDETLAKVNEAVNNANALKGALQYIDMKIALDDAFNKTTPEPAAEPVELLPCGCLNGACTGHQE